MDRVLDPDLHTAINERQGTVVLAHKELFPQNRNVLVTKFETRDELMNRSWIVVCFHSSARRLQDYDTNLVNEYQEIRSMDSLQFLGKLIATNLLLANIESNANCSSFVQMKMITQSIWLSLNFDRRGGIISEFDEKPPVIERAISVACFPHEAFGKTAFDELDRIV